MSKVYHSNIIKMKKVSHTEGWQVMKLKTTVSLQLCDLGKANCAPDLVLSM
jgi:hypothetical protein